jgi:hypothetical protein
MVAVAAIALNIGVIRWVIESEDNLPAVIFVPSLGLLSVAAVNVGLALGRRGWASPFATGYLLFGGLASIGVCLELIYGPSPEGFLLEIINMIKYLLSLLTSGVTLSTRRELSVFDVWFSDMILIVFCSLPQVCFAMIGGGLASRYGLTIVLRGRETLLASQETVSGEV